MILDLPLIQTVERKKKNMDPYIFFLKIHLKLIQSNLVQLLPAKYVIADDKQITHIHRNILRLLHIYTI